MRELVIPVRMETREVTQGLQEIGHQSERAGEQVGSMFGEMMKVSAVQEGLGLAKQAVSAIADSFKEAADHIAEMSQRFTELQKKMREIADLEGRHLNKQFIQEQIDIADKTKFVTTDYYIDLKQQWNRMGSDYVSPVDKPGTKNVEQSVIDRVLPKIGDLAMARNIKPETVANWLSAVVQANPKISEQEIYDMFFQGMEIAKITKGSAESTLSALTPIIAANVGQGMPLGAGRAGTLQAMRQVGLMQEAYPGQAASVLPQLITMFDRMKEEDMQELGITREMTLEEKEEAVYKAWLKADPEQKDFMKFWMPHMHGQGSMQAARDLRVAVTKGVKEGRNKRWKETQDSLIGMGEAGIDAAIEDIASQDVGQKLIAEKRTKVAQEQRGLDYTEVETALKETEAAMEEQGDFQQAFSWDAIRSKLIVNTPVLGPAQGYEQRPGRTQAESLRIQEETINTLMFRAFQADDAAMRREWEDYRSSRRTGPDEMKRLIEIAKSHHDIAASAARPPLSAPPPTPAQRD